MYSFTTLFIYSPIYSLPHLLLPSCSALFNLCIIPPSPLPYSLSLSLPIYFPSPFLSFPLPLSLSSLPPPFFSHSLSFPFSPSPLYLLPDFLFSLRTSLPFHPFPASSLSPSHPLLVSLNLLACVTYIMQCLTSLHGVHLPSIYMYLNVMLRD